jgi:hypothetical protein
VREKNQTPAKSARQGNLRHPRVRFQTFADSASLVSERLKFYPRVSEISLSCTFAGVRFYISHSGDRPVPFLTFETDLFLFLAM